MRKNPTAAVTCYINSNCDINLTGFKDAGSNYGTGLRPLVWTTKNLDWYTISTVNHLDDPKNPDGETKKPLHDGTIIYETIDMYLKGTAPSTGQVGFLTIDETDGAGNVTHLVYRINIRYRYNFNFDVNGGSANVFTKTNWQVSGGMDGMTALLPNPSIATWGEHYVEPTRDNFTFSGWYRDEKTTIPYQWGSELTKDAVVYAGWLGNFSLAYDGNGQTAGTVPAAKTVTKNEKAISDIVVAPANNLVRDGYTFKGWNTKADGNGLTYQPADTFPLVANTKLYAQWSKDAASQTDDNNVYKLIYDLNGHGKYLKVVNTQVTKLKKGTTLKIIKPTLKGKGISFVGWNTKANGTGTMYQAGATITINGNVTLYAIVKKDEQIQGKTLPNGGLDMSMPVLFSILGIFSLKAYAGFNKR